MSYICFMAEILTFFQQLLSFTGTCIHLHIADARPAFFALWCNNAVMYNYQQSFLIVRQKTKLPYLEPY